MLNLNWEDLLRRLEVINRKPIPVNPAALDAFEQQRGCPLPFSYRSYCQVFGAGEFGMEFKIAVPGYGGTIRRFSLEHEDRSCHDHLEYEVYSKNPEQHKRGMFFCTDVIGSYHFFDPGEITNQSPLEYAVYTVFSDFSLQRSAANFWAFVTELCLGDKHHLIRLDRISSLTFRPVIL